MIAKQIFAARDAIFESAYERKLESPTDRASVGALNELGKSIARELKSRKDRIAFVVACGMSDSAAEQNEANRKAARK
jgi:hypothetical protein